MTSLRIGTRIDRDLGSQKLKFYIGVGRSLQGEHAVELCTQAIQLSVNAVFSTTIRRHALARTGRSKNDRITSLRSFYRENS